MSGDHEEFLVRLRSDQYAVVDNFLSLDFANELLTSSQELIKSNAFSQHRFSFGGSLLEKPGVFEIDLSAGPNCSKKPSELGAWNELVSDFAPRFVKRLAKDNALALKSGTPAVKVQLNTGGRARSVLIVKRKEERQILYLTFPCFTVRVGPSPTRRDMDRVLLEQSGSMASMQHVTYVCGRIPRAEHVHPYNTIRLQVCGPPVVFGRCWRR